MVGKKKSRDLKPYTQPTKKNAGKKPYSLSNKDKEKIIQNFVSGTHPTSYSGIHNIYSYYNKKFSKAQISDILSEIDSYTLHKASKKFRRNPSFSYYKRYQFQIDLVELGELTKFNKNVRYLLNCIDTFTRFAWSIPLKSKTADCTLEGFKSILADAVTPPKTICSDRGSEIKNKKFSAFCNQNNIKLISSDTFIHAPYIERFNQTQKRLIYQHLTQHETKTFIDKLPKLMDVYNSRLHRSIGMPPKDAEKKQNHKYVRENVMEYYSKFIKKKPKFAVGQTVRVKLLENPFTKGYNPRYKEEVFKIYSIKTRLPYPLYQLSSYDGEEILEGNFYEGEITPVKKTYFAIEKVLNSRKHKGRTEYLVKWRDYKKPEWIPQEYMKKL